MVKGSLLDIYRKYNILRKMLYKDDIHDKLLLKLKYYDQENLEDEYFNTFYTIQEFELIESQLEDFFLKPGKSIFMLNSKYTWQYYFKHADQLLYGEPFKNDFLGKEYYETSNDLLFKKVVEELNKKFPEQNWQYGFLQLFHWQILNYPGYEVREYDIEQWENDPNIDRENGYYYQHSLKPVLCIYQENTGEMLKDAKDEISEVLKICTNAKENRLIYVIDRYDDECSGGYDLGIDVEFRENATTTFYNTELTPEEQVINETIVREIDERCAKREEIILMNNKINSLYIRFNKFIADNHLEKYIDLSKDSGEEF